MSRSCCSLTTGIRASLLFHCTTLMDNIEVKEDNVQPMETESLMETSVETSRALLAAFETIPPSMGSIATGVVPYVGLKNWPVDSATYSEIMAEIDGAPVDEMRRLQVLQDMYKTVVENRQALATTVDKMEVVNKKLQALEKEIATSQAKIDKLRGKKHPHLPPVLAAFMAWNPPLPTEPREPTPPPPLGINEACNPLFAAVLQEMVNGNDPLGQGRGNNPPDGTPPGSPGGGGGGGGPRNGGPNSPTGSNAPNGSRGGPLRGGPPNGGPPGGDGGGGGPGGGGGGRGGGNLGAMLPKVKSPPKYNGETPIRDWLDLMEDYHQYHSVPTSMKVAYSALSLTDEVAATWRERKQEMIASLPTAAPGGADDPTTWPIFKREMIRMYGPADPTLQAIEDLEKLTQTGSAELFVREFNKIIARMPRGKMNEFHKIQVFKDKLNPALLRSMKLNRVEQDYKTLTDIADHAVKMDHQLHGGTKKDGKKRKEPTSSPDEEKKGSTSGPSNKKRRRIQFLQKKSQQQKSRKLAREAILKTLQGLPPMSEEQKKKLIEEGKCFVCKEKGHRAHDCPTLAKGKSKKEN